jgi:anti-sigma regulatory factor (Ser/Thr protein kinase)
MTQNVRSGGPQVDGRTHHDEGPVDRAAEECSVRSPVPASSDAGSVHGHAFADVASDGELLGAALPYLEDGLREDDVVALAASPETVELISRALGGRARRIRLDPQIALPANRPPDAISVIGRYAEEAAARGARFRGLTEVDFGPEPADWREGERWESAFNRLSRGLAAVTMCVYDRRRLPTAVVDGAAATHPCRLRGQAWSPNPDFRDPAEFVPSLPWPREPLEQTAPVLVIRDAPRLPDLRHRLFDVIQAFVRDSEQREDLRLAAGEIAANAFRHGRRPVSARVWADARRMVCEITDSGTAFEDPFAGFLPAHGPDLGRGGMGLWLARKLWDHVDLIRRPQGFTVRLSTRLR